MTVSSLLASSSALLVSFYKPLLMFVTFLPWAWLVSSKLDKDARYLHLKRHMFNSVFMVTGVLALAAMALAPSFWIGWPLGILLLSAPVGVYWNVRNRAVPEADRFVFSRLAEHLAVRKSARAARAVAVHFLDTEDNERPTPAKDDPLFALHMAVEDLIVPALEARAAQVDLSVSSRGGALTQTIDGIRYKRPSLDGDAARAVIDYVKQLAGLNVEDRRRRQTTGLKMKGPTGKVELSVITAGSSSGQDLRLIFDRSKRVSVPVDALGLLPTQLEAIGALAEPHDRHGVILFSSPPGHGLSTTAYSLVARHDAYTSNVKTLEREVLTEIDGVDHVQFDPSNPNVDYATNLQSILRRDPDIVLVAEIAEREAAVVAADPAMDGPLIYVPQRAGAVTEQIRNWVKVVGDVKKAVKPLRAVINQRLLRRVCPNCRQPYQPSPEQLRKLNLPPDKVKQLYQASGKVQVKNKIETCPVCQGTGYFGQTGVFQAIFVGDDIRRQLIGGDLKAAMAEARRNKMVYLQEAALRKVVEGDTTVDEVVRVTAPARSSETTPKPQPKAAQPS